MWPSGIELEFGARNVLTACRSVTDYVTPPIE